MHINYIHFENFTRTDDLKFVIILNVTEIYKYTKIVRNAVPCYLYSVSLVLLFLKYIFLT